MQELWPQPTNERDIEARLHADERPKPAGRPWVLMVMISSLDGAVSVDGVSGGLGSPADQHRFVAARRAVDAIVVGSTTARVEDYRRTTVPIAVVTGRLSLDPTARLFRGDGVAPMIYTTSQAAQTRAADFDGVAEIVDLGESIRPAQILADLDGRGIETVSLEGGPRLNGQFLRDGLVDEILLTVSPLVVGGESGRIVAGETVPPESMVGFGIDRVLMDGDHLFVRYLRHRS